jgi:hypothetical protein
MNMASTWGTGRAVQRTGWTGSREEVLVCVIARQKKTVLKKKVT